MDWSKELLRISQETTFRFGNLSNAELNWKPNAQSWSIGQNLEHLIIVNESYYPTFDSLQNGTYKAPLIGKLRFIVSFMGTTVLSAVQPGQKKKIKTFTIWEPANSEIQDDILLRFSEHQKQLQQKIENLKPFISKGAVISSPANKNIVYSLETAFDIIAAHEQRHLEQANAVLEELRNRQSAE